MYEKQNQHERTPMFATIDSAIDIRDVLKPRILTFNSLFDNSQKQELRVTYPKIDTASIVWKFREYETEQTTRSDRSVSIVPLIFEAMSQQTRWSGWFLTGTESKVSIIA